MVAFTSHRGAACTRVCIAYAIRRRSVDRFVHSDTDVRRHSPQSRRDDFRRK